MTSGFPPGFQWDEKKNRINIREHGIDLSDAVRIFSKSTFDRLDDSMPYGEERTNSLGELDGRIILNVTHTERDGDIRLISARLANKREHALYREFVRENSTGDWADDLLARARQRQRDQPDQGQQNEMKPMRRP